MTNTARFWHGREESGLQCDLCPHGCVLSEGQTGQCRARTVRGNKLIADGYGRLSSASIDPVEKKPLHHFHPGAAILSLGGWGCNLACSFCQNWGISQTFRGEGETHSPDHVAAMAMGDGSIGVAYTYNEPLVGYEFVSDCARLVRDRGGVNVLVTNGYINAEPAGELLPFIDAVNVDIKSMDDTFYRTHCHGHLAPVLRFAAQAVESGVHVEVTNLLIPGLNDQDAEVDSLAVWIREHLGVATPLHLSAYRPEFLMKVSATPCATVERACKVGRRHLHYVFAGNVMSPKWQNTVCPGCGGVLIERAGYNVTRVGISGGKCTLCGRAVDAVL